MKSKSFLLGAVLIAVVTTTVAASESNLLAGVQRINFVGDSLTDGAAWTDWVLETLKANGYPHLIKQDAGVAGDNAPQLKVRFRHDVVEQLPDLVVLNIGMTDREPVEEYRHDVEWMVQLVQQSKAKLLLLYPPGVCDPKDPTRDARVVAHVEVLRELAKQYDCPLVDLHAAFAGGTKAVSREEQTAVAAPNLTAAEAARTSRILWGPDGVHHTINGWRTMARCVLDALGCHAPLIEKISLFPNSITDWYVSPAIAWSNSVSTVPRLWSTTYIGPTITWSNGTPDSAWSNAVPVSVKNIPPNYDPTAVSSRIYPVPPEIPAGFDPLKAGWHKYDREANIAKTSWWQKCWLERGGIMPMGQETMKDKPGEPSYNSGAFSLAFIQSDHDRQTTLHVGGSPPYAVWLNGKLVWNGQFLHGHHPSADRIKVTLHKGENHILVFTNWLFYISVGEI